MRILYLNIIIRTKGVKRSKPGVYPFNAPQATVMCSHLNGTILCVCGGGEGGWWRNYPRGFRVECSSGSRRTFRLFYNHFPKEIGHSDHTKNRYDNWGRIIYARLSARLRIHPYVDWQISKSYFGLFVSRTNQYMYVSVWLCVSVCVCVRTRGDGKQSTLKTRVMKRVLNSRHTGHVVSSNRQPIKTSVSFNRRTRPYLGSGHRHPNSGWKGY